MERNDPNRRKTTQIRKPPTGAHPAPAPGGRAPTEPGTRRLGSGGTGRASRVGSHAGQRLVKTSKPPSVIGRMIKTLLLLIVFLGIPGIIAASFFVKTKKGTTVAQEALYQIKIRLGLEEPKKAKTVDPNAKHPLLVALDTYVAQIATESKTVEFIQKQIQNQGEEPWAKEKAQKLLADLSQSQERLRDLQEKLSKDLDKLLEYIKLKEEAATVHEELSKDPKKKEALDTLLKGYPLPKELEEPSKDAQVQKYIELYKTLSLDEYPVITVGTEPFAETQRHAQKTYGSINGLSARLKEGLEPKKPEPPKPPPPPPFDPRPFHPWAGAKAETWVRAKITVGENITYQDFIVKEANDDGLVLAGKMFAAGTASDVPDREVRFSPGEGKILREEPVKVGDAEVPCRVVQVGAATLWLAKDGRAANRIALKKVEGEKETVATLFGEDALKVKDQDLACLVYEIGGARFWVHESVPGYQVKMQTSQVLWEVVAWGAELAARPEFPKAAAPKEPEPALKLELPHRLHPWAAFKDGAWARRKTTFKSTTATSDITSDASVVRRTDAAVVQKLEMLGVDGNVMAIEKEIPLVPPGDKPVQEDKLTIGGAEVACLVIETTGEMGTFKHWIAREGRAGALGVPLRIEGAGVAKAVTQVAEEKLPVAGRDVTCLRLTLEGKENDDPIKEQIWLSEEVPGFEVLRETVVRTPLGETHKAIRLIDFGDDASKKSALGATREDAAKAELRRVDRLLSEAERLVIDGSVIVRRISDKVKALPDDVDQLKTILQQNEEANGLFVKARETYVLAKDKAPDPAAVDQKIVKIDNVLEYLRKVADRVKAKLR